MRTRWAHRTERHFCAINTERLKFAFYAWILWHFLSIFTLYIFPFWQNTLTGIIRQFKVRETDRRNSNMQNCRFAWLRVWWLSVIVFLFLYSFSLSIAFMLWQRNLPYGCYELKHAASFSTQHKISSISIFFFYSCQYESGQFGENSICYCLRETQQKSIEIPTNWMENKLSVITLKSITSSHYRWMMIFWPRFSSPNRLYLKSDKKHTQNYGSIF